VTEVAEIRNLKVRGTQVLDMFGPPRAYYPTSCVICISLDGDRVISCLEGVPIRAYIVGGGGGQVYMEVIVGYKLRSPTRVLFG
jgi:hypothetical protein